MRMWRLPQGYQSLEEISKPLNALAAMGAPVDGTSWFVFYAFSRPLPPWRELDILLRRALGQVRDQSNLGRREIHVANKMRLRLTPASKVHPYLFILGGSADHDSDGFVVAELAYNHLRLCIEEKRTKVLKMKGRYPEWWLALEDRIAYGALDEQDQEHLRQLIQPDGGWNKIILVNPLNSSIGLEL